MHPPFQAPLADREVPCYRGVDTNGFMNRATRQDAPAKDGEQRHGMYAIVSLLVVLILSVTITKVASVALIHTGLSREIARLQARSAFTGVGFTTSESEKIVNHPTRRRILMMLMVLGNAGIVTAMSTLILGLVDTPDDSSLVMRIVLLVSGLVVLWTVASSQWVDLRLSRLVNRALTRWTDLDVRDYASLLQLTHDYAVIELAVSETDWLCGHHLHELDLSAEGVLILGIQRPSGRFLGAPSGDSKIEAGDTLILYGRSDTLAELDRRSKGFTGSWAHREKVREHEQKQQRELAEDEAETEAGKQKGP